MPSEGGEVRYSAPPPTYPPIQGSAAKATGVTNNLMSAFVSMETTVEDRFGRVLSLEEMWRV